MHMHSKTYEQIEKFFIKNLKKFNLIALCPPGGYIENREKPISTNLESETSNMFDDEEVS
jgi:hypothetical protein